jgi:transposase
VQRNGHIWRGKFVVTVLLGRYLNDAGSFCDVRTAWQARTWLPNSATMNTRWRRRFLHDRCDGLLDEARPGRPRTIDDDQVAAVIERTLRTTPLDATHWSIRSMAAETGFSHTTIRRMWVAFGLQPHRSETFKLSNDPLFVDCPPSALVGQNRQIEEGSVSGSS